MSRVSSTESGNPDWIASRAVGEATVSVVSDGRFLWAPRFPIPDDAWRSIEPEADDSGRTWFGLNVVLIEAGMARIVVDPSFDAPGARFERTFAAWAGLEVARSPGLDAALDILGWSPADVTHVVMTHPHGDHIGGLARERQGKLEPRFPHARHFLGHGDWIDTKPVSALRAPIQAVARAGLLDLVDGERTIAPGVTLVPAPGETPGHQVVRIESAGESAWVLGDLIHHACEVAHPEWAPPHVDARQVLATRRTLFPVIADSAGLVIVPHLPFPGWGHIVAAGGGCRFEPA